ncbi:MAG: hypothetical protein LLF94_07625 [Chlamydiales bacterium]|nr:hypothetical protein [Chlamydiales bacterium]
MERNGWFFRIFFLTFACITSFALLLASSSEAIATLFVKSLFLGTTAFCCMYAVEYILKKISIRAFNTALLGLFIGSLIGLVVASSLRIVLGFIDATETTQNITTLYSFLASVYIGITLTSSSQEDWWLSIPFVRLAPAAQTKKKELVLDLTAIEDTRLIELARSGLLDHQLVVPTFIVKEIQKSTDSQEEAVRLRGRKCQEHLKRLETMPQLDLQIKEFHFAESDELNVKLVRAAKLMQAYILSSVEPSQLHTEEDIPTTISLDTIATALKPGAQRGEILTIKIQRLGKEPKQGVGYLDDGTMVVVNGGGEFLSQTIRTQVLSQKYSSSGKIIFCNALTQDEKGNLRPATIPEGSPYHLTYQ